MRIGQSGCRTRLALGAIGVFLWLPSGLLAQTVMKGANGGPSLVGSDMAVFEAREPRKDLPCIVTPSKPILGFDLKFHSGFDISVPLKELSGSENLLTILFRVTSNEKKEEPVYFSQKIRVPSVDADAKGDAYLQGTFDIGEGKYQVDWLMRDRSERVCASFWDSEAALPVKDKALAMSMAANEIAASDKEDFLDEPPVDRSGAESLVSVKVLVNFAPQNSTASTLQPADTTALVSILRSIQRDPHIAKFSIVAFNLQEQRVLYRQDSTDHIDFPAIGEALKGLQLGRVNLAKLQQKNSETEFLGDLIRTEFKNEGSSPDALIFAGPKVMLAENVPADTLKVVDPAYPVFYMNYNLYPHLTPWRDSIGQAIRYFKGTEFTISRPRDLWFAVTEMVGKIVKFKAGKSANTAPSSRGLNEAALH
ncbi:acetyltransferase [Paludibaculum fermentans]|uniref:acetyltransferase n=1 Tax=Paludibaculum fermentans TaxID=1473598 RepID=UPI003EC11C6F